MGKNNVFELTEGFNSLITGVQPQTVPISAFYVLKNAVVINNKLQLRAPYYAVSTSATVFTTQGAQTYGLINVQPIKEGYNYILFCCDLNFGSYRVDNQTETTLLTLPTTPIRVPQYVKMGSLVFSTLCASGTVLGTKVYPTDSFGAISTAPIGLPKAASPAIVKNSSSGSGNWSSTGLFEYKITWVIDSGYEFTEGNSSDKVVGQVVLVTQDYFTFTKPATPAGYPITHWRLYRRNVTTNSDFQLIKTLTIATTTTNDLSDIQLPALNDVAPYLDHAQFPGSPVVLGQYKNRLWMGDETGKLYYSKVNSPQGSCQYFYSLGYFQIGDPNDEFIRLLETEEYLIVVKRASIWLVSGTDVSTFTLQKLDDSGSLVTNLTFLYNGNLYYINPSGIWKWDFYSAPINLASAIWQDFLYIRVSLNDADYTKKWFVVIDKKKELFLFVCPTVIDSTTKILVLNPKTNLWVGCYEFGIVSAGCNLIEDKINPYVLVSNASGTYKLYVSDSEILTWLGFLTVESTFNFSAVTGFTLPEITELHKKLYRFAHIGMKLLPESVSQSSGTVNFTVIKYDGTTASFNASLNVGSTISINKIHIGVTSELVALAFYGTAISAVKTIEIEAIKLEFESIGNY